MNFAIRTFPGSVNTAGETLSDEDAKTRANSPNVKYQADIQRLFADTVRRAIPGSDLHTELQNQRKCMA